MNPEKYPYNLPDRPVADLYPERRVPRFQVCLHKPDEPGGFRVLCEGTEDDCRAWLIDRVGKDQHPDVWIEEVE